jgi:hypothetical protein
MAETEVVLATVYLKFCTEILKAETDYRIKYIDKFVYTLIWS